MGSSNSKKSKKREMEIEPRQPMEISPSPSEQQQREANDTKHDGVKQTSQHITECGSTGDGLQRWLYYHRYTLSWFSTDTLLLNTIDYRHGLLDELCSSGVFSREETDDYILSNLLYPCNCWNKTPKKIVRRILNTYSELSIENKEEFLSALEKTRQSHVANYIRNKGQRPNIDSDNWPIYGSNQWSRIETNWSRLLDLIDRENGLLDELQSVECISRRHRDTLEGAGQNSAKSQLLLIFIQQGSFADYKKFVSCLERTKQCRVAAMLDPDGVQGQPLDELQIRRFETHQSYLLDLIDTSGGLLRELFACQCITRRQLEFIQSTSSRQESNRRLIDAIVRGSQSDFLRFVDCLDKTGQQHVSSVLFSDGKILSMVAVTDSGFEDESAIIEQFLALLTNTSPKHRAKLFERLDALKKKLDGNCLISMQTHQSIQLFFLSESLVSLRNLYELYSNGKLKAVVQQLFTQLLDQLCTITTVVQLSWDMSEFMNAAKYLSAQDDLSFHCKMYQLLTSKQYADLERDSNTDVIVTRIELFPHELIGVLLTKAIGQLFVSYSKLTDLAGSCALVTLCSVSLYWWETIADMHVKCHRYFFARHLYPYRPNVQRVPITLVEDRVVCGVAEYNDKLYVVTVTSNIIKLYDLSLPGSQLEDIVVPGAIGLRDIVVCSTNHCLFATDPFTRDMSYQGKVRGPCIWRVNLSSDNDVRTFVVTEYVPWTISVLHSELLVTPVRSWRCEDESTKLRVYSDDSQLIRTIQLPDKMIACHAVQTSRKTVVVCYEMIQECKLHRVCQQGPIGISELSADGRVLRAYQGPVNVTMPRYLVQDVYGNILIADQSDKQVLCLNSELELKHVLLTQLNEEPLQICYSHRTGNLFTCYCNSTHITVHRIAKKR